MFLICFFLFDQREREFSLKYFQVATALIVNKPDLKTMSKNKKKKMKKKEKLKQQMLQVTQQQIQVSLFSFRFSSVEFKKFSSVQNAEKQKQNLLSSPDQINVNKLSLNEEKNGNGHDQNSPDDSEDETPIIKAEESSTIPAATAIDAASATGSDENAATKRRFLFFG